MRPATSIWSTVILSLVVGTTRVAAADARIEVELLTGNALEATASQRWYPILTGAGIADLRIRSPQDGDRVTIVKRGESATPTYVVTAMLTSRNELVLPGARFQPGDTRGVHTWFERLRIAGPEVAGSAQALPFDLAPQMLAEAKTILARVNTASTRDVPTWDVLRNLHQQLDGRLRMGPSVRARLESAEAVVDELQGLSVGTVLAAVLRPAGLAFAPTRSKSGELQFVVSIPTANSETWPVGWPAELRRRELAPKLFDNLNVEISGVSVGNAVEAIRQRLELPLLYDHNALAAEGVELDQVQASLPAKRTSYSLALQRLLRQAELKLELRSDEANRPFFWVTTVKPISTN